MSVSRVKQVIEHIKDFSIAEKVELLRSLIAEGILIVNDDDFTEQEISEIEAASKEVANGEWVDFDDFRRNQNI
ncbi:MAG: hypothetical protein K6T80_07270 [Firmicutes bacterium]|nr:hypothetical protein [Bacillota bacterium]